RLITYHSALSSGDHHVFQYALAVDQLLFTGADPDIAVMLLGHTHKLGCRPGVQTQFVYDLHALRQLRHGRSRWRMSRLEECTLSSLTRRSAIYTERWWPPVQPMPMLI